MIWWRALLEVALALASAEPVLLVQDPNLLAKLDVPLARFLEGGEGARDNAALYKSSPAYRALVDSLAQDLAELRLGDPRLDVGMGKSHRLFDVRWLKAASPQGICHEASGGTASHRGAPLFGARGYGRGGLRVPLRPR